jgi:hypothetical protein
VKAAPQESYELPEEPEHDGAEDEQEEKRMSIDETPIRPKQAFLKRSTGAHAPQSSSRKDSFNSTGSEVLKPPPPQDESEEPKPKPKQPFLKRTSKAVKA